jgi:hypothetical protein
MAKDRAVLPGASHIVLEKILHKAPHRCQAAVSRDGRVAALGFDMLQKRKDSVGSHVVETQTSDRLALVICQE